MYTYTYIKYYLTYDITYNMNTYPYIKISYYV